MKISLTTHPKPGLHLTSRVLAAAGAAKWQAENWETTCLKARAAGLLKKISKLQGGASSAPTTGPATVAEAEERLAGLLAKTEARENAPLLAARDRVLAQSEQQQHERVRRARAWLAKLCLPIGGR